MVRRMSRVRVLTLGVACSGLYFPSNAWHLQSPLSFSPSLSSIDNSRL